MIAVPPWLRSSHNAECLVNPSLSHQYGGVKTLCLIRCKHNSLDIPIGPQENLLKFFRLHADWDSMQILLLGSTAFVVSCRKLPHGNMISMICRLLMHMKSS